MLINRPIGIVSLHVYPVKSCHRIDLEVAQMVERGWHGDREWMVVDPAGRFLTQRTHPALAQIRPAHQGGVLQLHHPQHATLQLPRAGSAEWPHRRVRIWGDEVEAQDCGAAAHRWISAALGTSAELVRADALTHRQPANQWRGALQAPVNFPDGFPVLVCNRASLDELNSRLPAPLPMTRFRPNLVIEGLEAWEEDRIEELQFGALRLRLVKPCTRCSTTTIDQESGLPEGDPLPALKTYRFDKALRGVTFGQNGILIAGLGASVRVGQPGVAMPRPAGSR